MKQAAEYRLPDFFVIGAAKAGTTTLYGYLVRHPALLMSSVKEPCFFSDDLVWERGFAWYANLFADATPEQLCGEASTTYTRWPHTANAAGRIAEYCPKAKLVYLLRHPVDRAYSHYAHHMRLRVTMTFEEAIEKSSIYIDCSRYMMQLQRYLDHFRSDQVHLLTLDQLKQETESTLRKIQGFLGVATSNLTTEGAVHANEGGNRTLANRRLTRVLQRVGQSPPGILLKKVIPENQRKNLYSRIFRSRATKFLVRDYKLPAMQPETRKRLMDYFEPEIHELEKYSGWDLAHWRS